MSSEQESQEAFFDLDEADRRIPAELKEEIVGKRGGLANVLKVHGLMPDTLRTHLQLYESVMLRPDLPLSRATREALAVAVSSENSCPYCLSHHAEALKVIVLLSLFILSLRFPSLFFISSIPHLHLFIFNQSSIFISYFQSSESITIKRASGR